MKINEKKALKPGNCEPCGFFRSIFAYVVDMGIAILLIFGCYFLCNKPIYNGMHGDQVAKERTQFLIDSHLATEATEENSGKETYSVYNSASLPVKAENSKDGKDGYKVMEDAVVYYYTEFLLQDSRAVFPDLETKPSQPEAFSWMNKELFSITNGSINNNFYEPQKTEGQYDYSKRLVLKEDVQKKVGERNEDTLNQLFEYYFSLTNKSGLYVTAYTDCCNQDYASSRYHVLSNITYYSRILGVNLIPLILFILLPLLLPNGKTLGKLIFGLSVIDRRGYKAKKWQILCHYLMIFAYWMFLNLPTLFVGIAMAMVLMIVDYLVRIISRDRISLHEKITYTMVVDKNQAFYDCREDLEKAEEDASPLKKAEGKTWEDKYSRKDVDISALQEQEKEREENDYLDLTTIGKARRDAATIDSFDEFESRGEEPTPIPEKAKEETEQEEKKEEK